MHLQKKNNYLRYVHRKRAKRPDFVDKVINLTAGREETSNLLFLENTEQ